MYIDSNRSKSFPSTMAAMATWSELLTPSPASRYAAIGEHFLITFSFPLFVAYLALVNNIPRWKRHVCPRPVEGLEKAIVLVNCHFNCKLN